MSQPEDTELRDLVIEALEKNGTLPTIRAQLRANIFNVFETEQEIKKENSNAIDRIFADKESCLSFSIIYEFLEYCGLRNTLFVYKSESRHGKGYVYEGKKNILHKLTSELLPNNTDEPILVQLIKTLLGNRLSSDNQGDTNKYERYTLHRGDIGNDEQISHQNEDIAPLIVFDTPEKYNEPNNKKDDENCTYIVHDDTASFGSCAQSQSDHSPDRYKLQLKLHLEQSETDTSSTDSNRDKSSSDEYIPSDNIPPGLILNESHTKGFCSQTFSNKILMQSLILSPHANENLIKSENRPPSSVSFDEKYASRTNSSTSYLHINIEPKVQHETVIKKVPYSMQNGDTSSLMRESKNNEITKSNSYSDNNSATTDNITSLVESSIYTPDKSALKSNTDKSQSSISHLLRTQQESVVSEDLDNKILSNISLPSEKSKLKQNTDSSSIMKSNKSSAKQNLERISISNEIATQDYTADFNTESPKSEGNSIESFTPRSNVKSDSDSIQEEINVINYNSETEESPRDLHSRSSISISDVAELIESSRIDSPPNKHKFSSQKRTNSNHSLKSPIEKSTHLINGENLVDVESPFKDLPSNKNITVRPCSNLNENEKAKFSTRSNDADTYSDSFSQTISTENMEWKSESI